MMSKLTTVLKSLLRAFIKSIPLAGSGLEQAIFGPLDAWATQDHYDTVDTINERVEYIYTVVKEGTSPPPSEAELEELYGAWGGTVVDADGILTEGDRERLRSLLQNGCLSLRQDRESLKRVVVRPDGLTDYLGYYTYRFTKEGHPPAMSDFEGVIVLNSTYLRTIEYLESTACHEYGHHFFTTYITGRTDYPIDWERVLKQYLDLRGVSPKDMAPDYEKGWENSAHELFSEDYRCLFTPYKQDHSMEHLFGLPSPQVRGFILGLKNLRCICIHGVYSDPESVNMVNYGNQAVDMTGWHLVNASSNRVYLFPSFTLQARAGVRITSGPEAVHKPPDRLIWTNGVIWEGKDSIAELFDGNGNLISKYP